MMTTGSQDLIILLHIKRLSEQDSAPSNQLMTTVFASLFILVFVIIGVLILEDLFSVGPAKQQIRCE